MIGLISLDYTGLPDIESLGLIWNLFKNHRFSEKSALYTNFYAKRINVFSKVGLPYVTKFERTKSITSKYYNGHFQRTIFQK